MIQGALPFQTFIQVHLTLLRMTKCPWYGRSYHKTCPNNRMIWFYRWYQQRPPLLFMCVTSKALTGSTSVWYQFTGTELRVGLPLQGTFTGRFWKHELRAALLYFLILHCWRSGRLKDFIASNCVCNCCAYDKYNILNLLTREAWNAPLAPQPNLTHLQMMHVFNYVCWPSSAINKVNKDIIKKEILNMYKQLLQQHFAPSNHFLLH